MQGRFREEGAEGSSIQSREAKNMKVIEGRVPGMSLHWRAKSCDSGNKVNHPHVRRKFAFLFGEASCKCWEVACCGKHEGHESDPNSSQGVSRGPWHMASKSAVPSGYPIVIWLEGGFRALIRAVFSRHKVHDAACF